jgi:tetratricopeptide (TPR) repeat protein
LLQRNTAGGTSRVDEWRLGLDVLRAHPLTGVGPEGYRVTLPTVVTAAYERAHGSAEVPDRAHDLLLDVAVTTGLPGLAAYLAVLALCGTLVWRAVRTGDPWVGGVAAGLVAYTVQELFLFPIGELEPAVWLLVGLVAVRASRPGEQAALRLPSAATAVAVGLALVAAVAGGRDVAADHDTRAALADLTRGQAGRAQAAASRAAAMRPDQIDYRLASARADAEPDTLAGIAGALRQVRLALDVSPGDPVLKHEDASLLVQRAELSPTASNTGAALTYLTGITTADHADAEGQLELGVVLALRGEQRGAEDAWLTAARLAPSDAGPPTDLATLYATEGRWKEAISEARAALSRDPSDGRARQVLAEAAENHGT